MDGKICLKKEFNTPAQPPPVKLDTKMYILKLLDSHSRTLFQILNIFAVNKKDTRMGLLLSNIGLTVIFEQVFTML